MVLRVAAVITQVAAEVRGMMNGFANGAFAQPARPLKLSKDPGWCTSVNLSLVLEWVESRWMAFELHS
jgi:hypothetical protein